MQIQAAQLLIGIEDRRELDRYVDSIKLALVSADPMQYRDLIFPGMARSVAVEDEDDDLLGNGPMSLDFSQSEVTPEEAMQVLMAAPMHMNLAEIEDGG